MRTRLTVATPSAVLALSLALGVGCKGGRPADLPHQDPPRSLSYSANPAVYTRGTPITPNVPTVEGEVRAYYVSPGLPPGLTLDQATGAISGTPTTVAPTASYTITVDNYGGSTSTLLTLTVNDVPPSALTYSANPAVYTLGVQVGVNVPSSAGGPVVSYAVSPALPPGLTLNSTSGVIGGTPTAVVAAAVYTVTATNSGGSTTAEVSIAVNDWPPAGLAYPRNPVTYVRGSLIAPNVPTHSGGAVAAYSVSPALPEGLVLNVANGIVSGIPRAVAGTARYTVTATNPAGSTQAALEITVIDVPPTGLAYATNPAVYTRGVAIAPNAPSAGGGAVVSYAVSPPLPAGLVLDASSGVIGGTPTGIAAAADYTVTATNSGGSTTAAVRLTVNDQAPSGLAYATNPAVYTRGVAIAANAPTTSGGGPVVSYAVSPTLPAGLALDASSGVIGGTPTAIAAAADYTVTATNSGGSTTAAVRITVNDVAPSGLAYATNPAVYARDVAIAPNAPTTSGGGAVVSYAVSPPLPAGLALHPATGVISGTPTAAAAAADYTVTATNSGGSTTAAVRITVNDVAPSGLAYATNPAVYTRGVQIAPNGPTSGGGAVVSYAVSPLLPAGLALDPSTGVISGAPTVLAAAADYTVTAANSGGSTTVVVRLTVNDQAPSGLAYATRSATYLSGLAIAPNLATSGGGPVVSWSVAPALPAGLALDPGTGAIGGTPEVAVPATDHLVTATNSGGSTTARVTIAVTSSTSGGTGAIAAGNYHACAVVHGAAQCWGSNAFGQLGDGTTTGADRPVQVGGLTSGVQAIAAGGDHACALVNGGVWCWGYNGYGQLGDGTTTSRSAPVQVSGLGAGVQAIAAGPRHTCAIVAGGVRCWGDNGYGQLGDGSATSSAVPVAVPGLGGVQAIDLGTQHTCVVADGGARCWGRNYIGQLGDTTTTTRYAPVQVSGLASGVQAISARGDHTCAIVNGGVRCWGANVYGSLGDGSNISRYAPVQVAGLTSGAQALGSGADHNCAVVGGALRCWGNDARGELGDGTAGGESNVPVAVSGLASGVRAVTLGANLTCALASGGVRCWGLGYHGQLGTGDGSTADRSTPAQVFGLTQGLQELTAGRAHTCALVNGGVRCWGADGQGQLGDAGSADRALPGAVLDAAGTAPLAGATALAAGMDNTCALVGGGVQCWGASGWDGQLGDGKNTASAIPVHVVGTAGGAARLAGAQAVSIAGNDHTHACAIVDGGVVCWGGNTYGMLGNGDTTVSATAVPLQVSGLTAGAQAIAAGGFHTCAVVGGAVRCWGSNGSGQLGDGTTTSSPTPVASGVTSGATAVGAGYWFTCAVVNGGAWCWGRGNRLGVGSTANSGVPVQVTGLASGVQAIAVSQEHACALVNGGVQCWGSNGNGQLGDGGVATGLVPVAVPGLERGVLAITAGDRHTCAATGASVRCWGYDDAGQLGNGSMDYGSHPPETVQGLWP